MQNLKTKLNQIHANIFTVQKYLTSQFQHSNTFNLVRTSLFCLILLDTLIVLPVASQLWSPHAYIPLNDFSKYPAVFSSLNLLSIFNTYSSLYVVFVLGKIFFLILGILNIVPLLSTVCVYFFLLNLDNKAWVTMHGGNNIVHVVFIYLILMHFGSSRVNPAIKSQDNSITFLNKRGFFHQFGNVIANFAFYSARMQIVLVYLVAGLTKLQSHLWRDGVALYYVLNTREFTHPWAQKILLSSDLFIVLGTYGTLLFQLSFPWLVWNKYVKRYVLLFGTFIHLQISFVMGLFDFGLIVSIMYLAFLSEQETVGFTNRVLSLGTIPGKFQRFIKAFPVLRLFTK